MSKFKTQIGEALTADFQENTWTFEMPNDYKIKGGEFAIVPKEQYDTAIQTVNNLLQIEDGAFQLSAFDVARFKMSLRTILSSLE